MNCFKGMLGSSPLLAHTWASRPVQHGVFFSCSGMKKRPSHGNFKYYTMGEGEKSRCKPKVCRKCCADCLLFRFHKSPFGICRCVIPSAGRSFANMPIAQMPFLRCSQTIITMRLHRGKLTANSRSRSYGFSLCFRLKDRMLQPQYEFFVRFAHNA